MTGAAVDNLSSAIGMMGRRADALWSVGLHCKPHFRRAQSGILDGQSVDQLRREITQPGGPNGTVGMDDQCFVVQLCVKAMRRDIGWQALPEMGKQRFLDPDLPFEAF